MTNFPLLLTVALLGAPLPNAPITVTGHAWAPFISPMGEPFRAHDVREDTLETWFRQADRNHDGALTVDEMVADAERFFARLDTNHDGEIDPDELDQYEWELAPEIQVNSRTKQQPGQSQHRVERNASGNEADQPRRSHGHEEDPSLGFNGAYQGGARYGLLNIPEPVASADSDFDRAITLEEFKQAARERFNLLDTGHTGQITINQLELVRSTMLAGAKTHRRGASEHDLRLGNPVPGPP